MRSDVKFTQRTNCHFLVTHMISGWSIGQKCQIKIITECVECRGVNGKHNDDDVKLNQIMSHLINGFVNSFNFRLAFFILERKHRSTYLRSEFIIACTCPTVNFYAKFLDMIIICTVAVRGVCCIQSILFADPFFVWTGMFEHIIFFCSFCLRFVCVFVINIFSLFFLSSIE